MSQPQRNPELRELMERASMEWDRLSIEERVDWIYKAGTSGYGAADQWKYLPPKVRYDLMKFYEESQP